MRTTALLTTVCFVFSTGQRHGTEYREDMRGSGEKGSSVSEVPSLAPLFLGSLQLNMRQYF